MLEGILSKCISLEWGNRPQAGEPKPSTTIPDYFHTGGLLFTAAITSACPDRWPTVFLLK